MLATNSASASGGMTSTQSSASSFRFFKRFAYHLVANRIDDLEGDQFVSQQSQQPFAVARRWFAKSHRDQLGFTLAIQKRLARRCLAFLSVQCEFKTLGEDGCRDQNVGPNPGHSGVVSGCRETSRECTDTRKRVFCVSGALPPTRQG